MATALDTLREKMKLESDEYYNKLRIKRSLEEGAYNRIKQEIKINNQSKKNLTNKLRNEQKRILKSPEEIYSFNSNNNYFNINQRQNERKNKDKIAQEQARQELTKNQQFLKSSKTNKQLQEAINRGNLLEYQRNAYEVKNDDVDFLDKINIGKSYLAGLESALDNPYILNKTKKYIDENGNTYYLPSKKQMESSKLNENMGTIGKAIHGGIQSLGQMTPAMITSALPVGNILGPATTFTTTMNSAKMQKLVEGYSDEQATKYAIVNAGLETALGKALGGATKIMGGKSSALSGNISKLTSKVIKNKGVNSFVSNLTAEGIEEELQYVLNPINEYVTLGKYNNIGEALSTLEADEALVTALSTLVTIGLTEGPSAITESKMQKQIDSLNKQYNLDLKLKDTLDSATKTEIVRKKKEQQLEEIEARHLQLEQQYQNNEITEEKYNQETENINNELKIFKENNDNNINDPILETQAEKEILDNKLNSGYITQEKYDAEISKLKNKLEEVNPKIKNFRESSRKYWEQKKQTKEVEKIIEKIITEKDYNVTLDPTIKTSYGQTVAGKITTNDNGGIDIKLNPDSDRIAEFLIMHEVTHAIETDSMKKLVMDFASKNQEFNQALESLKQTYGTEDVSSEVLADISGQLFGNQEFINNLSIEKPNIFKRLYNSIISLANKITGNSKESLFIKDLKNKWETAYRNTTTEQAVSNLNNETFYSKQVLKDGTPYVQTETGLFTKDDGTSMTQREMYNSLVGKTITFDDGITAKIVNRLPSKDMYNELFKRLPRYQDVKNVKSVNNNINENVVELLENSKNISPNEPDYMSRHQKQGISSFDTRKVSFYDGKNAYDLDFSIAKLKDGSYVAYAKRNLVSNKILLNKIKKEMPRSKSSLTSLSYDNTLPQKSDKVKLPTKYSMQGNKNNTQELENSSFSLEQRVSGDELLDAQDLIEEIKSVGAKVDKNGYVTLYHQTTNENADKIKQSGKMFAKEPYVYFSTSENASQSDGRGNTKLEFKIPAEKLILDDIFDDNADVKIKLNSNKELDVSDYIISKNRNSASNNHKQKQLDIILKNNPVYDDYHTWIRNIDDVKTFEETLQDSDYKEYYEAGEDFDETYTANMAKKALETGKITVYSSYPIEQGIFVSPSRMEAESYSGNGKVYSKEVNLTDVAWIDPTQGQYAKVSQSKYSKENKTWQEHLEENYEATGTRTNFSDIRQKPQEINTIEVSKAIEPVINDIKTISEELKAIRKDLGLPERQITSKKIMNPNEISKLTKQDANTTPKLPIKNVSTGKGKSSFYKNVTEKTKMLSEEARELLGTEKDIAYYKEVTNEESLSKALEKLDKNGANETLNWFNKESKSANSVDVAEGWILMKQYENNKDYDGMVQVAKKLREIGTEAGQTVQAFNIMNRLTPEGMVKYAQSELTEAYEKMVKNKTKEWIDANKNKFELTPQETQFIVETMKEVSKMEGGYEKRVKLAEIQKLMTDKLPPERGAGIKAWMRISMLFNPKTQVRNVVGNALIAPVNTFSDLFASKIDKAVSKRTGVRTTGTTNTKVYLKGMKTGMYQSYNDFKKGINTRNMEGNRFEIGQGKSFNDNKKIGNALNKVDNFLSFMLDAGDRMFYEASFTNSINNQLVLNNTTEVTQDMIDIATQEALSRTWQDNNKFTNFVLSARKGLNNFIGTENFGLGDVLIPFAKTPANLTKAIVDYSPVGVVNAITKGNNLRKSLSNGQYTAQMQHEFVQTLGKATAGTMLYIIGIALAKAGISSGESDDDKDVANFLKNTLGVSSYSIKIGDKSFTYDWAQPIAAPISITANIINSQNKEKALAESIVSNLDTAGAILLEQSFLQSINDVLNNTDGTISGLIQQVLDLPARAIPTFSKQLADLIDGTQRTTFEKNKPLATAKNKVISKLPIASKTLAPTIDTLGRKIQKYGGKNDLFNVFFNPANVNGENISESAKEIYRIYQVTSDKTIFPRVPEYTYKNVNGEKIVLSSRQRSDFQKTSGEIVETSVANLLQNEQYNKLSDEDKASVIKDIVDYAYNKGRLDIIGIPMSKKYDKINEYTDNGGTITNYYLNKEEVDYSLKYPSQYKYMTSITDYNTYKKYKDNIDNIRKKAKALPTQTRKVKVINYVNGLDLDTTQKAMLIKNWYKGFDDYNSQIINYVNSLELTKNEKQSVLKEMGFKIKGGRIYW